MTNVHRQCPPCSLLCINGL